MKGDPSTSVIAWKRLVIEKLQPRPGDLLLVTGRDRDVREKAGDALEEALAENGLKGQCTVVVGPSTVTITHIPKRRMNALGWVRERPNHEPSRPNDSASQ